MSSNNPSTDGVILLHKLAQSTDIDVKTTWMYLSTLLSSAATYGFHRKEPTENEIMGGSCKEWRRNIAVVTFVFVFVGLWTWWNGTKVTLEVGIGEEKSFHSWEANSIETMSWETGADTDESVVDASFVTFANPSLADSDLAAIGFYIDSFFSHEAESINEMLDSAISTGLRLDPFELDALRYRLQNQDRMTLIDSAH